MATDGARRFWEWLDEQQRSRGEPVRLRARFSGDPTASVAVPIEVEAGEPRVRLAGDLRAAYDALDPAAVADRYEEPEEGMRWRESFDRAGAETWLSLNAACRLILGPRFRPTRRVHAFNANVELHVDPADASRWIEDVDATDPSWPSLSDLIQRFEDRDSTAPGRPSVGHTPGGRGLGLGTLSGMLPAAPGLPAQRHDANAIALRAVRAILDAAESFDLTVEGTTIHVAVERLPPEPWPAAGLEGLDATADGPLPGAVRLVCSWSGGSTRLTLSWWQAAAARYRNLIGMGVRIDATRRMLLWITVALPVQSVADGGRAALGASLALVRRRDALVPDDGRNGRLRSVVERSGLSRLTEARVLAFEAEVPSGAVLPSPGEAFRRLVHVSLLKLPFFLQPDEEGIDGDAPFDVAVAGATPAAGARAAGHQRAGLFPLPGGVRRYQATLTEILAWFADASEEADGGGRTMEDVQRMFAERYEATGPTATRGYFGLLVSLGYVEARSDGLLELTDDGRAYVLSPSADAVFERLDDAYEGILATLVVVAELGAAKQAALWTILNQLLDKEWQSSNQPAFRANWLLSLGLTDRTARGDILTEAGRATLARHPESAELRQTVAAIIAEDPELAEIEADADELPSPDVPEDTDVAVAGPHVAPHVEPASWGADRLDLTARFVEPHLGPLQLPPVAIHQVCAALSSGKHLLLVGPPGTGKTELAAALANAAKTESYCHGAYVATASADWTTFDTIGGYALKQDGSLAFRSGVFLQAIERWQWLIIDELNRADVDRAFGELMTVLAGRSTDTPFELPDGRHVSIGGEARCSHRLPRTFRVIATMNTWDKTSLFRLSYAVQRRFAIVHVGIPDDATYADLVDRYGQPEGIDPPLEPGATGPLKALFRVSGLLGHRPIGPAILVDIVRYMRRRRQSGDGLAEALAMYLLPQLEGLDPDAAAAVFKKLDGALRDWTSHEAIAGLRERYQEIFPNAKLPEP